MKTYILFLIKRALCRKGNWLTAGVYFLVVLLFWGMNMHAQSQIKETIQEQIRLNEQTQVLVPEYKEALDAYETKDWDSFTSTYLTILDKQKAMVWQQSEDMVEDLDNKGSIMRHCLTSIWLTKIWNILYTGLPFCSIQARRSFLRF